MCWRSTITESGDDVVVEDLAGADEPLAFVEGGERIG